MVCLAAAFGAVPAGGSAWAQGVTAPGVRAIAGDGTSSNGITGDDLGPDPRPAGSDAVANPASPASLAPPSAADPYATPAPGDAGVIAPVTRLAAPPDDPALNGGKPKPKKPKLYKPDPKVSPPLAPVIPYKVPGRPVKSAQGLPEDRIDPRQPAPTVAVIPTLPQPRRPVLEDDPYAPVGVGIGALRLFPFVELSSGYETNPNDVTTGARASAEFHGEAGFDLKSDFPSNSVTASLRGGYTDFTSNPEANRPDGSGTIDGILDVTRDDKVNLEGRFILATQTPGSPLLAVPGSTFLINRPVILTDGFTVGETHQFNRLSLSLRGTFDRTQYGDGTGSDGSVYRFSQDNFNDYGLITRATYELTPALIPFAEVGADSRIHDNPIDLSGYARDSNGLAAKLGSTFEFTRLLTGNAAIGYAGRHYADTRLPALAGPTIDGALVYNVTPLTTATLKASTFLTETTLAGASGAISRSISLELAHALFRNFTVSVNGTFQVNQYQGIVVNEVFSQEGLKATYKVSRDIQIFGSLTRQDLSSSLQGSSFTDVIGLVGIRLQR